MFSSFLMVDRIENLPVVRAEVEHLFAGRPLEALGLTWADAKSVSYRRSELMVLILRAVGVLAILVLLGVAFTTVAISIEERRADFAALRLFGFGRGALALMVLLEGILLLAPGAVLGGLATFAYFHDSTISLGEQLRIPMDSASMMLTWLAGVVLAVLAAFVPARQIFRNDVLTALREA
jgi:putative ABC transport system permease protein